MSIEDEIPDVVHIRHVRKLLWTTRDVGRAAVMVGAGFSRNAISTTGLAPPFPLWPDLRDLFQQKLGGLIRPSELSQDPLVLAEQYECFFRRDALETLLGSAIPDLAHEPGDLHRILLSLPWSDVFTTNYDTLLERARAMVTNRRYEEIHGAADLVGRLRPRIVKLHGTLPSRRPITVTQEDYRTYPQKNPTFVNTVQQSIMENAFCLLGFSGDDPNFLAWTGWVRDHLGLSAPRVYLCGVLDLTPQMRVFLERHQQVTPVDLGALFPASAYPASARHQLATEWLVRSLANYRRDQPLDWPRRSPHRNAKPIGNRHLLPSESPEYQEIPTRLQQATAKELKEALQAMESARAAYPGWLICPRQSRSALRERALTWLPVVDLIEAWPVLERLRALATIIWVLDRCLLPLFDQLVLPLQSIEQALPTDASVIEAAREAHHPVEPALAARWAIASARLRSARINDDQEEFPRIVQALDGWSYMSEEMRHRLQYERAQWALQRLKLGEAKHLASSWDTSRATPIWLHRKAAVLADVGEPELARALVSEALARVRSFMKPDEDDIHALSHEAAMMWVAEMLEEFSNAEKDDHIIGSRRDRWLAVERVLASPRDEAMWFSNELQKKFQAPRAVARRKAFHTDRYTENVQYSHPTLVEYTFSAFREEVGVPAFGPLSRYHTGDIGMAARRLYRVNPIRAIFAAVRVGADEALEELLARTSVAAMEPGVRDSIFDGLLDSLEELLKAPREDRRSRGPYGEAIASGLKALARLGVAVDRTRRRRIIHFGMRLASDSDYQTRSFSRPIGEVYEFLLPNLSADEHAETVRHLVEFPLGPLGNGRLIWPEPFVHLDENVHVKVELEPSGAGFIAHLIELVRGEDTFLRERSAYRLYVLSKARALTVVQEKLFLEALWSRVEPDGLLPANSWLSPVELLDLPDPDGLEPARRIERWVLGTPFPSISEPGKAGETATAWHWSSKIIETAVGHFQELHEAIWTPLHRRGIRMAPEHALRILERVRDWCRDQPVGTAASMSGERAWLGAPVDALAHLVAGVSLDVEIAKATPIMKELVEKIPQPSRMVMLPAALRCGLSPREQVERQLEEGLLSPADRDVVNALHGIRAWIFGGDDYPASLVDELIYQVAGRRSPGLRTSLEFCTELVDLVPSVINARHIAILRQALVMLFAETDSRRPMAEGLGVTVAIEGPDRPDIRVRAVKLAAALHSLVPDVTTERWRVDALADPLPEIRKAATAFKATSSTAPGTAARSPG